VFGSLAILGGALAEIWGATPCFNMESALVTCQFVVRMLGEGA